MVGNITALGRIRVLIITLRHRTRGYDDQLGVYYKYNADTTISIS